MAAAEKSCRGSCDNVSLYPEFLPGPEFSPCSPFVFKSPSFLPTGGGGLELGGSVHTARKPCRAGATHPLSHPHLLQESFERGVPACLLTAAGSPCRCGTCVGGTVHYFTTWHNFLESAHHCFLLSCLNNLLERVHVHCTQSHPLSLLLSSSLTLALSHKHAPICTCRFNRGFSTT